MGIMNKVKFWKKDDVFLDDQSGFDSEMSSMNTQPDSLGLETSRDDLMQRTGSVDNPVSFKERHDYDNYDQPTSSSFNQTQPQTNFQSNNKDFELISSKLDTIKAELDSMNQRLKNIEKNVESKETKKSTW
jgi:hypothetical protein